MKSNETILHVDHLYIQYSGLDVVRNAFFDLKRGEILGIIGESGCGKSTLINAVLGLLDAQGEVTNGSIQFFGQDITKMSVEELQQIRGKRISAVFQNPGSTLNPIRKVKHQFYETLSAHGKCDKKAAEERALDLLKKLNLPDPQRIMNSYPVQFSGGMNQRIAIALAMAQNPEIIIGDELTSALDVTVQAQVVSELLHLKENFSTAMIIVSHNMGMISYMADTIAVMYAGEIVEYGAKDEIMNDPHHPYTKALIEAIPLPDGNLPEGLPGRRPNLGEYLDTCNFADRCRYCTSRCRKEAVTLRKLTDHHSVRCFI